MKKVILFYVGLFLLLIIIPILSVLIFGGIFKLKNTEEILVYIKDEDRVVTMNKEEYLIGVVAAEMPVEFEKEALKAQAVAARTYLENKIRTENTKPHKGAVICTDHTCCQAWISEEKRKESWEDNLKNEYWNKICSAVSETRGKFLTYDGKIISALFHSTSSGNTENASDVWGEHIPYLVSVQSSKDELSSKFYDEKQIPISEYKTKLSEKYSDIDINKPLFENIERSAAGGIKTLTVCGKNIKGTEFRTLFELRSTNAEFFVNNDFLLIKTKGYGHGVGMSQYGANFMAQDGKNYEEILKHYYSGIAIVKDLNTVSEIKEV